MYSMVGHSEQFPNFYLSKKWLIPAMLGILIGETIYNLRAILDYLVYELAILDSGQIQKGTQFPIEDTESEFDSQSYLLSSVWEFKTPAEFSGKQDYWIKHQLFDIALPHEGAFLLSFRAGMEALWREL